MKYLLLAAPALFLCSCATVVRGTDDTAKFESTPSGAGVTAESISEDKMGPYNCVAPCELELKRKRTWRVDFALEGYKPVSGLLKPVLTGEGFAAGVGNALIGGLVGVGIDAGTGANLDLRPNPMVAELEPIDSPAPSRILDAEIITDGEAGAADEGVEVEEAPAESPAAEAEGAAAPAPADNPVTEDEALEGTDEPNPDTSPESANDGGNRVGTEINGPSPAPSADEELRLYKPGERAPNDEVADDLNRRQLESAGSIVNEPEEN